MHEKPPFKERAASFVEERPASLLVSHQRPGLRSVILLRGLRKARRSLSQAQNEEQILKGYLSEAQKHFSQARIAICITGATFGRSGILRASTHDWLGNDAKIRISKDALHDIDFGNDVRTEPAIEIVENYAPLMKAEGFLNEGNIEGFDVPVVIADRVIGALYLEMTSLARPSSSLLESAHIIGEHLAGTLCIFQYTRESAEVTDYVRKFLNFANVPVLALGLDRSIRVASPTFASIHGETSEALLGRDFLLLVPEAERIHLLTAFTKASQGLEAQPMEVRMLRSEDTEAVLRIKLSPILDADQKVNGVMVIGTDITEMRALEGQVVHAERLATLGKLAAGIVHEINNPLTSISAYSSLLIRRNVGDESDQERLRRISQGAERILHYTRGLVAYARPNRERSEKLSLNTTLDESLAFCEHVIKDKQVSVLKDYANSLPPVEGVRNNLHQVFINLITNACQAATGSEGQLMIQTKLDANGTLCAEVQDKGEGISPKQLQRIFDPFYTTKPEGEGTGLGLPIAKSIVEQHGGRIEVDAELGVGATFRVYLPSSR